MSALCLLAFSKFFGKNRHTTTAGVCGFLAHSPHDNKGLLQGYMRHFAQLFAFSLKSVKMLVTGGKRLLAASRSAARQTTAVAASRRSFAAVAPEVRLHDAQYHIYAHTLIFLRSLCADDSS